MNIRDALMQYSPSLALQRGAQDEIARQDGEIKRLKQKLEEAEAELATARLKLMPVLQDTAETENRK